ncbi:hypothetical protein [Streptomyces sp. NPDC056464]|uniref:hypothetical protein n=1 Tax=Streptomyces sp. NPDC056464 TaxID=3345828 RepID=UPI0036A7DD75
MPKTTPSRTPGTTTRRTMTAAARAAAKRAARNHHDAGSVTVTADKAASRSEHPHTGRTVLIEAPKGGWQDPPEPSPDEFEGADTPQRPEKPGKVGRRRLLTVLLGFLLVAGLVALAVLGWHYRDGRQTEAARTEAVAAARKAAPTILSYDHRHLDRDFAKARAHLTGGFSREYGKTTKTVVGPTAKKYRGVVKATIAAPVSGGTPAVSVVSASPDEVVVLLFVNQVTESTQVSGSRLDLNRVRMTMSHTTDGWKVSAVDAL